LFHDFPLAVAQFPRVQQLTGRRLRYLRQASVRHHQRV